MVAEREGYMINIIRADMSNPLPFDDSFFDIIFHPVSNCYVEEVKPIWHECYRVLRKGGVLVSGLDIGINYIFDLEERVLTNRRRVSKPTVLFHHSEYGIALTSV